MLVEDWRQVHSNRKSSTNLGGTPEALSAHSQATSAAADTRTYSTYQFSGIDVRVSSPLELAAVLKRQMEERKAKMEEERRMAARGSWSVVRMDRPERLERLLNDETCDGALAEFTNEFLSTRDLDQCRAKDIHEALQDWFGPLDIELRRKYTVMVESMLAPRI